MRACVRARGLVCELAPVLITAPCSALTNGAAADTAPAAEEMPFARPCAGTLMTSVVSVPLSELPRVLRKPFACPQCHVVRACAWRQPAPTSPPQTLSVPCAARRHNAAPSVPGTAPPTDLDAGGPLRACGTLV